MSTRVLHIIARMNVGGTSSFLYNLISNSPKGFDQLLVLGRPLASEIEDPRVALIPNVRIANLGRPINPISDFKARRQILNVIEQFQPHIINTHTFKAGMLTRSLRLNVPVIHTFHGHLLNDPEFQGIKRSLIIQIERYLAKRTTILSTTGEIVKVELEQAGLRHRYWRNVYPGMDSLKISERTSARNLLGLADPNSEKLHISWHSRFAPVKNVQLVMEVAAALPNCVFLLSGGGPLYEKYQTAHPSNVFILGWQSPELIFSASDILISTSFNEGLSFSLIEASMAGRPCVATSAGAASEIIEDGKSGFLVENNRDAFIEKIQYLNDNRDILQKMGEYSRNLSTEKFGIDGFIARYQDLFEEAIQRASSDPNY